MERIALGRVLEYSSVCEGLRAMNAGMHFDLASKHGQWHPFQNKYAGVFYMGRHICSMDRGQIPEFKIWSVKEGVQEIPPEVAACEDMAWVHWNEILPDDPLYQDGITKADTFDAGFCWQTGKDGNIMLVKNRGYRMSKVRGPIVKLGWRHSFERILIASVPGIDRRTLAERFSVDLLKFPVGAPEEIFDALIAE